MKIYRSDYADNEWPFEFDEGEIIRATRTTAVFVLEQKEKMVYALNGVAAGLGGVDLGPVWRDNPDLPPGCGKISLGPWIARALRL